MINNSPHTSNFYQFLYYNITLLKYLILFTVGIFLFNLYLINYIDKTTIIHSSTASESIICYLQIVWNAGSVLGLMSHWPAIVWILISIGIIIYILYCQYLYQLPRMSTTCIIAGGLGNVLLRIYYGSVPDYIHCQIFAKYFITPIFNINDLLIIIGLTILLFYYIRILVKIFNMK